MSAKQYSKNKAEKSGRRDALLGLGFDLGKHGARTGSQWADWYKASYQDVDEKLKQAGPNDWTLWHFGTDEVPRQNPSHERGYKAGLAVMRELIRENN